MRLYSVFTYIYIGFNSTIVFFLCTILEINLLRIKNIPRSLFLFSYVIKKLLYFLKQLRIEYKQILNFKMRESLLKIFDQKEI